MATMPIAELDELLVSDEFIADPYPNLYCLREEDPVHWSDSIGEWVLTKYDDMTVMFQDTSNYSNEGRLSRAVEYLPRKSRGQLKTFEDHYRTKGLLHSDPPDHRRVRALVTKAFTPRLVEGQVVFQTIIQRLPGLPPVKEQPDWELRKPNSRMLRTLPVQF
jgi:cytochrome P450